MIVRVDSSEEEDVLEADELGLRLDGYWGRMKGGGVPVGSAEGGNGEEGKAVFKKWSTNLKYSKNEHKMVTCKLYLQPSGVNFIHILHATFTQKDTKRLKS